ncbi:MAG: major facilitator superfamily 1 [Thermomicrobiales bacterium]|nr:major facilitator superfamily 1 [Thermomicrobiales bacterium]
MSDPITAVTDAVPERLVVTGAGSPRERRVLRPRQHGSFRAVLSNYPFLRLWIAQAVSQTANSMVDFSLLLRVGQTVDYHHVAQANTAVSFVILAFSLPAVVFGPIAGAVADRISRRNLMVITNIARAALVLLFLLVQPNWPVQIALASYYTVSFLFGAVGQFFMPAQGASIPALVPRDQLTAANALFNLTFTATQLLGFAILGPLLAQALGVDMLFILTMVAFVISALLTLWLPAMPIPHRVVNVERVSALRRVWADIREGLVYIKQDPILTKAIAYLTFATTIFMLIAALAPNFVATVVGLPPGDIGYLVAPAGIGVIVGVVIVPRLSSRFRRDALIDWAVVVGGLALLLLSLSREILSRLLAPEPVPLMLEVALAGGLAAILGICNALVLVPSQTILQERSHEHIRARVYATFFTITSVVSFIPIFFAAAAADIFGVVTVLAAVAILLVGVGSSSLIRTRVAYQQRHERVRTRHRQGPEAMPPVG